ncbi:MAG: RES family NAD+ phosphorylase [Lachnospiraceae bacterium]|nr:RES family NAD+ phosphorylase [Candidatus Merdinaster equi]
MDYIPTQFISEYIRYELRYDGIKYKSAMSPEGSNYVLFFDDSYVAEASEVYDMKNSRLVFTKRLFFVKSENYYQTIMVYPSAVHLKNQMRENRHFFPWQAEWQRNQHSHHLRLQQQVHRYRLQRSRNHMPIHMDHYLIHERPARTR